MKDIFKKVNENNINYTAQIVSIQNIDDIPNADNIKLTNVYGNDVIITKDFFVGQLCIYCPIESKLNSEFLSWANMYDDATLNSDNTVKGYINSKSRVRAVKMRGVVSKGLLIPIGTIFNWAGILDQSKTNLIIDMKRNIGYEFDTISDVLFIEKYVIETKQKENANKNKKAISFLNKIVSLFKSKHIKNRICDGQFQFHKDTPQLLNNLQHITDGMNIIMSKKYHGTSGIVGKLLVEKDINIFKKLFYKLTKRPTTHYELVASSRNTIREIGVHAKNDDLCNVWTEGAKHFSNVLTDGMTIYYEAVGFVPGTNKIIQKGYDYGCNVGKTKFLVYRITEVLRDGTHFEYDYNMIADFCTKNNIDFVKGEFLLYNKNLTKGEIKSEINNIITKNNNKIDEECAYKVPFEGYCFRVDKQDDWTVYKWKSDAFILKETAEVDKGLEQIN